MKTLLLFIIFAITGVAHEVFWTSLDSIKIKNWRLKGRSSLWMFLVYGAIAFIIMLVQWLYSDYPWWMRGLIYMALIFVWEYSSGWMIQKLVGVAPWDYDTDDLDIGSKRKFNINGLVCLEYAPIWFIEGLLAEWFYLVLITVL